MELAREELWNLGPHDLTTFYLQDPEGFSVGVS